MRARTSVKITDRFNMLEKDIIDASMSAVTQVAEEVMTDSKLNYVPVVDGYLRNSGTVTKPTINGNKIEIRLGYGGPTALGRNVTYAFKVHEAPDYVGQGKNKYLSRPLNAIIPKIPTMIAGTIRHQLLMRRLVR